MTSPALQALPSSSDYGGRRRIGKRIGDAASVVTGTFGYFWHRALWSRPPLPSFNRSGDRKATYPALTDMALKWLGEYGGDPASAESPQ